MQAYAAKGQVIHQECIQACFVVQDSSARVHCLQSQVYSSIRHVIIDKLILHLRLVFVSLLSSA